MRWGDLVYGDGSSPGPSQALPAILARAFAALDAAVAILAARLRSGGLRGSCAGVLGWADAWGDPDGWSIRDLSSDIADMNVLA
mmetsp:Transcript_4714/g.13555  ORF Transcript_4714/g.13555 Transcript_4714/m.13555 type:complete len:84 (+) Transcript_4714:1235-1486(+)